MAAIVVFPSKSEFLSFQKRIPIFGIKPDDSSVEKRLRQQRLLCPKPLFRGYQEKSSTNRTMEKKNQLRDRVHDENGKRRRPPCDQPKPKGV